MKTFISMLRGINVTGHKMIKMKALQEMYEGLGFKGARTYIQSGNVVFESTAAEPGKLETTISAAILKSFGFEVPVIVVDVAELETISRNNVFINERTEDIVKLHVTFLSGEAETSLAGSIRKEDYLPDEFFIDGKAVYLFCPNGYGNTKLNNTFFEKKLKVRATTRNWRTVLELLKMGHAQDTNNK